MILLIKKRMLVGCLLVGMLTLLGYAGYNFRVGQRLTLSEITRLFDRVVHQDKGYRLKETEVLSSSGDESSKNDSTTISYSGGHVEKIAKKTNTSDLTTEEKQYRVDQSYLLIENPIDVVALDSLFNFALQQNNMANVRAALVYTTHEDKPAYSNPDLTFYESACALPPITTGIKDEIVLQAYVKIPFYYVISRSKGHFISVGVICSLLLGLLMTIGYSRKLVTPVCEESRKLIQIKENILFDEEKGMLYFDVDIQVSLENYKLKLFILLLNSPEHFQTSEKIKKIVWGKSGATNNTLNTTIKRLRADLKPIPDLTIAYENGGYRLDMPCSAG